MTLTEAAAYLKVSQADVQGLISGGEVKAKKIGTEFRISKKALDDFLAA
jgi:excisionase family DNA binding protein